MRGRYSLVVEACLRWLENGYEFNAINETLKDYGYNSQQREEIFRTVRRELKRRGKE